jgi:hypothetical protein
MDVNYVWCYFQIDSNHFQRDIAFDDNTFEQEWILNEIFQVVLHNFKKNKKKNKEKEKKSLLVFVMFLFTC